MVEVGSMLTKIVFCMSKRMIGCRLGTLTVFIVLTERRIQGLA